MKVCLRAASVVTMGLQWVFSIDQRVLIGKGLSHRQGCEDRKAAQRSFSSISLKTLHDLASFVVEIVFHTRMSQ